MPVIPGQLSVIAYGRSFAVDAGVTTDNGVDVGPTLAAAKTGTLTTRTDNDTGVVTAAAGHGIISTNKVAVYWSGGSRRNMTATVSVNAVTVDGGSGDNLPVLTTAVTLMVEDVETGLALDGDDVQLIAVQAPLYPTTFAFRDDASAELLVKVLAAGESYVWSTEVGGTNPLAGVTVAEVAISHGGSGGSQACPCVLGWS